MTDNGDGTATFSGTPPALTGGTYPFTITAKNGVSPDATQNFTLSVLQAPQINSADHVTFTVGQAGTFKVTSTGVPNATLSETGALPSGVTLTDNKDGTATLSGAPAALTGGTYPFTITAKNGVSPDATQNFILTVNEACAINSADNATFDVGKLGTFTVTTSTGWPKCTLSEPRNPPPGVGFNRNLPSGIRFTVNGDGTATISGTPAVGTVGAYLLKITATNGVSPDATQYFHLTVLQAPTITSADHTTCIVGQACAFTVTSTGSPTPYLSETGKLPTGVTFTDNLDGTATLSGTPAAATGGTYPLNITAANTRTPYAQPFTLTVKPAQACKITSLAGTTFTVGQAGTFTVKSTGVPTCTSSETGTLPTGVTFTDNADGTATLSGTPAAGTGGTYTFTITATNGVSAGATQSFTLTVNPAQAAGPPAAPTNLTGTRNGGTVSLTWMNNDSAPSLATVVWIQRSTDPGFTTVTNTQVGPTATTYSDTTARVGTTYYYRVVAWNVHGFSGWSNVWPRP